MNPTPASTSSARNAGIPKNSSKKRSPESKKNSGNVPIPTPSPSKKKAPIGDPSKHMKKDYLKTFSVYECTMDPAHTWNSTHGWPLNKHKVFCEFCEGHGKILEEKDELDIFVCACGERWCSLHNAENTNQACDTCERSVACTNQTRYATHYWYECKDEKCKTTWEDAYIGETFSQRCRICGNAGKFIGRKKETEAEQVTRVYRQMYLNSGGSHDIEGCDMCQKLIRMGYSNCRRFKKMEREVQIGLDGEVTTRVSWI